MIAEDAQLHAMLTRLQLTGIRDRLDALVDEAARKELDLRQTLAWLCAAEVEHRDQRRVAMGTSSAKRPFVRSRDAFDSDAQPSIDAKQVRDLSVCRWVANGDNVLILGPPGVGKTHLAVGLGRAAIARGYSTHFVSAAALVTALAKAHHDGTLDERITFYAKPKLLIVDEIGYLPREKRAASLFFQLVATRDERGSMLLTGNRSVGEWGDAIGDSVVTTAVLDRPLHHSQGLTIRGESYRLREKRRAGLLRSPTTPNPTT